MEDLHKAEKAFASNYIPWIYLTNFVFDQRFLLMADNRSIISPADVAIGQVAVVPVAAGTILYILFSCTATRTVRLSNSKLKIIYQLIEKYESITSLLRNFNRNVKRISLQLYTKKDYEKSKASLMHQHNSKC